MFKKTILILFSISFGLYANFAFGDTERNSLKKLQANPQNSSFTTSALAASEQDCIQSARNGLLWADAGRDAFEKAQIKATKVVLMDDLPEEVQFEGFMPYFLKQHLSPNEGLMFTLFLKKSLCDLLNSSEISAYVRLIFLQYHARFITKEKFRHQQTWANAGMIHKLLSPDEIYNEYMTERLQFNPQLRLVKNKVEQIGLSKITQNQVVRNDLYSPKQFMGDSFNQKL